MPELPEVEITRRHLSEAVNGRTFESVIVSHPRTARHNIGGPGAVESRLAGRKAVSVGRHGKFLVTPLDDGSSFVAHLGMSGRFKVGSESEETTPHTHFTSRLDDGTVVSFIDPRTFGFVAVFDDEEISHSGLATLGPDAWTSPPGPDQMSHALANRTASIKALLLDQRPIAGLGNIYADEALFLAGIDPRRPGGEIARDEISKLLDAIQVVLANAIDHGGTSLDDLAYLLPDGRAGENLAKLQVYGRAGETCFRCGDTIDRVVIRARSTHFCPGCQVEHG